MNPQNKHYTQWSRKDFESLPELDRSDFDYTQDIREFVILPTRKRHDSGYRIMDIIPIVKGDTPLGRFAGMTDSIQLGSAPYRQFAEWKMDCLNPSGLIRFWSIQGTESRIKYPYSTFEISVTESINKTK